MDLPNTDVKDNRTIVFIVTNHIWYIKALFALEMLQVPRCLVSSRNVIADGRLLKMVEVECKTGLLEAFECYSRTFSRIISCNSSVSFFTVQNL